MDLSQLNVLVIGLAKTSRTETLENYLRERTRSLAVVALGGVYGSGKHGRCTLYHKGKTVKSFPLFSFSIKNVTRRKYPLITVAFGLYIFAILYALVRLHKRFDLGIMVATASALVGCSILRPLRLVKRVIFYCIDYYPPGPNHLGDFLGFQKLFHKSYMALDKYLIGSADLTWEISPRIEDGRRVFGKMDSKKLKRLIVPLGYSDDFCKSCQAYNRPIMDRERWTLGFIGVLSPWQGLKIVAEAMPELCKEFPKMKVRVIGDGPYMSTLKKLTKQHGVEERFVFHGFVEKDEETFDILSRCVAGLATWRGDEGDYSRYADPGKPKLYALLGLPVIMTSGPYVSSAIAHTGAGEIIEYAVPGFIAAVRRILGSDEGLKGYIDGVEKFKPQCRATEIFDKAFETERFNG